MCSLTQSNRSGRNLMSTDRGYRDVSSPEAKARIWQEAHEHARRDYPKLLERARNHTTTKDHA